MKLKELEDLLWKEGNNPIEIIMIKRNDGKESQMSHHLNTQYCCWGTGWGVREKGEPDKEIILKSIGEVEAVILKVKYGNITKFKKAFSREMHWISQQPIRMERFNDITKSIFKHVDKLVESLDLNKFVIKNTKSFERLLPVNNNKANAYISARNIALIESLEKEITCKHVWIEHGHGYKCSECGFYTGLNQELNKLIKNEQ